jgi:uncharacterized BrkB/YihY/UPF0761 family membrane protein
MRICATFRMFFRVVSTAASIVIMPCMFTAAQVTRMLIALRSALRRAMSTAKKLMKVVILLVSVAILVLVMMYLYYIRPHISHER